MYWPYQQSTNLNEEVANLFIQTYYKFFINLRNKTNQQIPLDILTPKIKKELLIYTLIEIEIIILDIIELNLNVENIEKKSNQIMYSLIYKIIFKLLEKNNLNAKNSQINFTCKYNQIFFEENNHLFNHLLTYLTFGAKYVKQEQFKFKRRKTPKYHVKILLEHFIIQMSNIVLLNILEKRDYKKNLFFLVNNDTNDKINNKSIRELSNFQNNFLSYNWIYYYIYYPQNIYCNQHKVWLFSSKGIIYKYIYANRYSDYLTLSPSLMSSIIYLELQDFIVPKINFLIILLGKLLIYISIEFINKSIKILLNQVISRFDNRTEK